VPRLRPAVDGCPITNDEFVTRPAVLKSRRTRRPKYRPKSPILWHTS